MKRGRKKFKTIFSVLLVGGVMSVSSWAFAQGGGISSSVEAPTSALSWETGTGKSYLIPALEIPAFLLLLNVYDRLAYPNSVEPDGKKTYDSNMSTLWDHVVHEPWGVDTDSFAMNQFGHPYQ